MTKINDPNEVQFRQINPSWIEDDIPSSQAFMPTKKDDGKLSLDRSANIDAKQSRERFTSLGLKSAAVFGLTPLEFETVPNPVECFESPLENNPDHSHADFTDLSNAQTKRKAKELKKLATARGKLHP